MLVNDKERCTEILNSTRDKMLKAVNENLLVCKVVIQLIEQGYYAVPEWYISRCDCSIRPDIVVNNEIAVEVKEVCWGSFGRCLSLGVGQCIRYLRYYKEAWLIMDVELETRYWEEIVWMRTILPQIRFWVITANGSLQEVTPNLNT
jgi:hypothetical protein